MAASRSNLGGLKKASSVSDFKKKNQDPVELPSGHYIVLKNTSMAGFLQGGNIPNGLMKIVQTAIAQQKGEGGPSVDEEVAGLMSDPEKLTEVFETVDAFVCAVAVEPRVHPKPEDEDDRDDELLYVDELELEDKMFIFSRAMGSTEKLEQFREESAKPVGRVQPRKAVGGTTKRAPRS